MKLFEDILQEISGGTPINVEGETALYKKKLEISLLCTKGAYSAVAQTILKIGVSLLGVALLGVAVVTAGYAASKYISERRAELKLQSEKEAEGWLAHQLPPAPVPPSPQLPPAPVPPSPQLPPSYPCHTSPASQSESVRQSIPDFETFCYLSGDPEVVGSVTGYFDHF